MVCIQLGKYRKHQVHCAVPSHDTLVVLQFNTPAAVGPVETRPTQVSVRTDGHGIHFGFLNYEGLARCCKQLDPSPTSNPGAPLSFLPAGLVPLSSQS